MGEELDGLSLKELQSLEQQLDSALKHIRSRKVKAILTTFWLCNFIRGRNGHDKTVSESVDIDNDIHRFYSEERKYG